MSTGTHAVFSLLSPWFVYLIFLLWGIILSLKNEFAEVIRCIFLIMQRWTSASSFRVINSPVGKRVCNHLLNRIRQIYLSRNLFQSTYWTVSCHRSWEKFYSLWKGKEADGVLRSCKGLLALALSIHRKFYCPLNWIVLQTPLMKDLAEFIPKIQPIRSA